jgi:hypothetical protein
MKRRKRRDINANEIARATKIGLNISHGPMLHLAPGVKYALEPNLRPFPFLFCLLSALCSDAVWTESFTHALRDEWPNFGLGTVLANWQLLAFI